MRYACMQRGHVGYACLEIGAYAEAEQALRDAMAAGARLGLANVVATAKHNLGRALMHRGQLADALATETEAFDMFHAQNDRRLEGAARVYLAMILFELGDLPRAEHELAVALATAQDPIRPQILATRARVLLAARRPTEALAAAREAHDLLEALGGVEEGESQIRLMLVETLLATGDREAARTTAARAVERLAERAARISNPAYRATFLDAIREHIRLRDLATHLAIHPR